MPQQQIMVELLGSEIGRAALSSQTAIPVLHKRDPLSIPRCLERPRHIQGAENNCTLLWRTLHTYCRMVGVVHRQQPHADRSSQGPEHQSGVGPLYT
ncbi:hypothetical protein MHYP_G00211480 [Metynnis hypsauchen]